MALRRPKRAIETFDIALMAVVTKAMGAFLVLMLLMIPSYVGMPETQQKAEHAEATSLQRMRAAAQLTRQVASLEEALANAAMSLEQRRERARMLEQENDKLRQRKPSSEATRPALYIVFSWADCDADTIDFYIHGEAVKLENGSLWPEVRREGQPPPSGVLERQNRSLHITLRSLLGVYFSGQYEDAKQLEAAIHNRLPRLKLWIIPKVAIGSRYAIYAKVGQLRAPCSLTTNVLVTAGGWGTLGSHARLGAHLTKSGQILLVRHIVWTGSELKQIDPTPADQAKLDEKFGFR